MSKRLLYCNATEETSDNHFLASVFLAWVSIADSLLYPGNFADCLQKAKA
jgi:hypothetical protein